MEEDKILYQTNFEIAKDIRQEIYTQEPFRSGEDSDEEDSRTPRSSISSILSQEIYITDDTSYEELLEIQERIGFVCKGVDVSTIEKNTQKFVMKRKANEHCVICLEDFNPGESTRILHCNHFYHSDCIECWLKKSKECPICKKCFLD